MALTDIKITDEQKMEWLKQYIDFSKDVVKVGGRLLLTAGASKQLAEKLGLPVAEGQLLRLNDVTSAIIARESQAFFARESMRLLNENINKQVELINSLVAEGKNDYQIARDLYASCEGDLKIMKVSVQKAVQMKYILQENMILANVDKIINKNTATNNFANAYNKITDATELTENLSNQMLKIFTGNGLDFGNLVLSVREAIPDDKIIEEAIRLFYIKYEPFFMEKYGKSSLSDAALAKEVFNYYVDANFFDARIISSYVANLNRESLNMDDFDYTLYCLSGEEKNVFDIVMNEGKTAEEKAQLLFDNEIQFPISCIKRTFDKLKGVKLPFDEILSLYAAKFTVSEELEEEADINPVERHVAPITEGEEGFEDIIDEVAAEEVEVAEEISKKAPVARRLKIKEKKKEVTEFGKKKTLGAFLIAAGFLPVAVLSWQFKVDPSIAARNCAMALEQLASGSMGIKDLLPSTAQLTALLAGMGTSLLGLVKYLRNKKKQKSAKAEITELETGELDDELEVELERELLSDEPRKRGKK